MMDDDGKPWWQSKTITAAIAAILVTVLSAFGIQMAESDAVAIISAIGSIITCALTLFAIWGRIRADQKIK